MGNPAANPHATSVAATRGRQLAEVLLVVRLISRGRWRVEEISAELGLHRRTIYRLLAGARKVGIPVERQQEGMVAYWRLSREAFDGWLYGAGPPKKRIDPTPKKARTTGARRDSLAPEAARMTAAGASNSEIIGALGVAASTIAHWRRLKLVPPPASHKGRPRPEERALALRMLREGRRIREVAAALGVHGSTVAHWSRDAGLTLKRGPRRRRVETPTA